MSNETLELFLRAAVEKAKKRRKQIRLPVDLAGKNGEFPQPNASLKERIEQIRFLTGYLSDIRRANEDKVVATVMRVLRENRKKSKRTDWFRKHYTGDDPFPVV
jgi:hypothetical protein